MKKIIIISMIIMLLILTLLGRYFYIEKQNKDKIKLDNNIIEDIRNHYNKNVILKKDSYLYQKVNKNYKKVGTIYKGTILTLKDISINTSSKYFKIKDSNFYIYYKDVEKSDSTFKQDKRYQHYIYFNEKIKTKNNFTLYRNQKKVYTFYQPKNFRILIKDDDQYGVIYQDDLYYIKKEDIENTESIFGKEIKAISIPVTVYHFLYLENESCNEIICNSIKQVREEFNYLRENNYFTLTTKEMEYFIKGRINLPKNSILITIDDGAQATKFLPILDEYQFNATLFLISSWYKVSDFKSDYLELASHTHNLHTPGVCSGGGGSPLKCMNKEELLSDLALSRETLNNTEAFCFPFYEYNDYAIEVVKEAGFKTAYIGGEEKVALGIDPYKIPRITIHNNISINQYINLIK